MIKILVDEQKIQAARLPKFGYNVKLGLEHIKRCHKDIQTRGETYDSLRIHVFDFLQSAKNSEFKTWVSRVKSDISCGTGEYKHHTPAMIITAAKKQYLNMTTTHTWDKVDSHNA